MKKQIVTLILALLPVVGFASTGAGLMSANVDLRDKAALQDGLNTFVHSCMGCHSAQFQRYERVAKDLGISEEDMMSKYVMTSGTKIGDLMQGAMRTNDAKAWFGVPPPDLTMVSRVRGNDWVYSYLHTFYRDPSRPFGVNNETFPNAGMPNVFEVLQGQQIRKCTTDNGVETCTLSVVPGTGSMTPEQFDTKVRNLVTFLAYSADPNKLDSHRIGTYVLIYLAILILFAYLLKREYWRELH